MKYVSPSVRETAFNCPHCGALAKQFWHAIRAENENKEYPRPTVIEAERDEDVSHIENKEYRNEVLTWIRKMKKGIPYFEKEDDGKYTSLAVYNLNISKCYNCDEISVWIYDRLVYPISGEAPPANPDMPEDIRRDYDEASRILDLSPRGAAALVRLCIQKLCIYLGQPGKNINNDIAALVKAGLDERIQKALDAVRVIGNQAVHPGSMDLRDDRATAEILFKLLNTVVDKMISEPKHINDIYATLPTSILSQIEARDKR